MSGQAIGLGNTKNQEGLSVVEILVVMVLSFVLVGLFSFLEVVWLTVYDDDVVSHESTHGGPNRATKTIKTLLRERMVVESFVLFVVFLVLSASSFCLGRLTEGKDGVLPIVMIAYTVILFFVGEVAAKNIGYRLALPAAIVSAIPVQAMMKFFFPITWLLRHIQWITGTKDLRLYGEKDVVAAAQAAEEHGGLHPEEADLIERALAVGNKTVGDLMIPFGICTKVVGLKSKRSELVAAAMRHNKIVVCAQDGMTIVGMIRLKKIVPFLCGDPNATVDVTRVIEPTVDLPKDMPVPEAIRLLRKKPMGTVTFHGKPVGVVITNDLLDLIIDTKSE